MINDNNRNNRDNIRIKAGQQGTGKKEKLQEEQAEIKYCRISENIDTLIKLNSLIRDSSEINQDLVERLKEMTHIERLKEIENSNNPHMYQMSAWFKRYGSSKTMNNIEDLNIYFKLYLNLYITLYYVIILKVWEYDQVVSLLQKHKDKNYLYKVIPELKHPEQIVITREKDLDREKICHYDQLHEIHIQHDLLPVIVLKYNGVYYFKYKTELDILSKLNTRQTSNKNSTPGNLELYNRQQYNIQANIKHTIKYLINNIVTETHSQFIERIKECRVVDNSIYPIYEIDSELLKELISKKLGEGGAGEEMHIIEKFEKFTL